MHVSITVIMFIKILNLCSMSPNRRLFNLVSNSFRVIIPGPLGNSIKAESTSISKSMPCPLN